MKLSDYIARRLAAEGISKVFLLQGAANNSLLYALADTDGIDYVCGQHEAACGHMAEGYAKVSGKPGVAVATSGPGGQNLVTAIANCYYDSVPALFLTGQVMSRFIRPEGSPVRAGLRQLGFQETPITEIVAPITKHAAVVQNPEHIRYALEHALWLCQEGRPGPVLLDLPIDVQCAEIDPESLVSYTPGNATHQYYIYDPLFVLVEDLHRAQRPALLIGGGARGAIRAVHSLACSLGVPCFPTWNALDIITSDFELYGGRIGTYGGAGRNFGIQNCDLLIAIGCRISGRITGGAPETFARGAKKYVVDIDPGLLDPRNQQVHTDVGIRCDANEFAYMLEHQWRRSLEQSGTAPDWSRWRVRVRTWREKYDPVKSAFTARPELYVEEGVHPYVFARKLSEMTPDNAIIVSDCGGNAVVMHHAFETKAGQRFFSSHGNSPMGFALAGAIGAWFAAPERPVICVIGDGGLMINLQELQTLVTYGAKVKVFVLDNGCYGITQQYQRTHMAGRLLASGPDGYRHPDFVQIADAFGLTYCVIDKSNLRQYKNQEITAHVLRSKGPMLCIVHCPGFSTYEPRVGGWNTPIEDMEPLLDHDEFESNLIDIKSLRGT